MKEVTKEEYMQFFKDNPNLKVYSSFTDVDGDAPYGYGRPAFDTEWGFEDQDEPLAKCEGRKSNKYEAEWQYRYFLTTKQ